MSAASIQADVEKNNAATKLVAALIWFVVDVDSATRVALRSVLRDSSRSDSFPLCTRPCRTVLRL